ncbi:MAG TPA: hypothetical protein VJ981_00705 [Gammaproteobacteria bacterium]|nr:hypothetical protein [Gammaproteobacteria bacterium]
MNKLIVSLTVILLGGPVIVMQPARAQGADYTNRNYTESSCALFARDAYQAADKYHRGIVLQDLLDLIESAPVSDNEKHRAFQAIQFVWKNRLDNPTLASTLAMGLCLKPKQEMAPMDEPWLISPRTSREFY